MGKLFIAYVACTRPSGETMTIAAAFTQGDSDHLMVGRNGLFHDRDDRDWDARIIKIIDHPISIRQAFWSPYKRRGKMISDTVERVSGDAAESVSRDADRVSLERAGSLRALDAASLSRPIERSRLDTGMLAAIGIAATSLVSGLSALAASIFGLPVWKIPVVFLMLMVAVSGPAMIVAFLKLRQRTLGPILEANGWAINGRVRINLPLGNSLTQAKQLPAGAKRLLEDPFEDKDARRRLRLLLATLLVVTLLGALSWLTSDSYDHHDRNWRFWQTWGTDNFAVIEARHLDESARKLEAVANMPEATADQKLEA